MAHFYGDRKLKNITGNLHEPIDFIQLAVRFFAKNDWFYSVN